MTGQKGKPRWWLTPSWLAFGGLVVAGAVPAWAWWPPHDPCATVPPGAMPAPNGTAVRAWNNRQVALAQADDFVVYRHEWYADGVELGPYGQYHLREIVKRLPTVPFPIFLQIDIRPEVTEARRLVLVQQLTAMGVPDAERRVVVGYPPAEALAGEDALRIYGRQNVSGAGRGIGAAGGFGVSGGFGGVSGGFGIGGFRGY